MQPISHACTCRESSASRLGTSAAPPTPPARTVQSTARRSRRTFGSRRASMQVRCHRLPCAPSKSDCHVAQSPRRSPADEPTHWAALLRGRDRRQQRPQEHRRSQLRAQPHAQPHSGPRQLGPQRKPTARLARGKYRLFSAPSSFPHQAENSTRSIKWRSDASPVRSIARQQWHASRSAPQGCDARTTRPSATTSGAPVCGPLKTTKRSIIMKRGVCTLLLLACASWASLARAQRQHCNRGALTEAWSSQGRTYVTAPSGAADCSVIGDGSCSATQILDYTACEIAMDACFSASIAQGDADGARSANQPNRPAHTPPRSKL
jgi:hypothetical protein